MRICKLQIKNYRSISDTDELSPTKLFALIGKNNSGKSTLVRAIRAFWMHEDAAICEEDFHKNTDKDIEIIIRLTDFFEEKYEKHQNKEGNIDIKFSCAKDGLTKEYYVNGEKTTQKIIKEILPELLVIPAIRNPQGESTAGTKSYLKALISAILKE